jgi:alpha-amylase/alpha-mannosidase (GH57 family)
MARADLAVAVLWHMHQPDYVDSLTGQAAMPWVRLHALLSYFDMVRVAEEVPGTHAVFNLVPILIRQLAAYADGRVGDAFLDLARPAPGELSGEQRALLLRHFFAFNHGRRFRELPRLAELWEKRGPLGEKPAEQATARFDDQELRDLQVGFHLAWSGRTLREHELVAALLKKGRGFAENEKADLLALQQEFLGQVLPRYRAAAASGVVELSCTPYAHPILPLLCDTQSAREARPELPLPEQRFHRPGDAWYHVQAALDIMEAEFGSRPTGMWPAEGSLSEEAIRVFATAGVRWLGGDQDVLAASTPGADAPPGGHFRPWRWGGDEAPVLFFRDKGLSDRIGFVYQTWPAEKAAADFVGYLQRIRSGLPAGRFLVPIMLDGENPWEGYPESGVPFLQELYRQVAAAEGLRWETPTGWLAAGGHESVAPLPRLLAGSWINHDFTTWIGHPEKNAGWDRLYRVRDWLQERLTAGGALREVALALGGEAVSAPDPARLGPDRDDPLARAWLALAAAEGSDWFWWYGDDHPTDFGQEFDALFRSHLSAVYRHLGSEPDPLLQVSLRRPDKLRIRQPRFPLEVTLDGRVTSYFEWLDAGRCETGGGGAMHRAETPLAMLHYGGSPEHLLLRLDPVPGRGLADLAGAELTVRRLNGKEPQVSLVFPATMGQQGPLISVPEGAATGIYAEVIEVAVPWPRLDLGPGDYCDFFVALSRKGETELVIPAAGSLGLRVPVGPDDAEDWIV